MKYVKMLGLLAVAAAALMAFAATASATTLTSPAGTTYTSTIKASAGETTLHGVVTITCKSSATEGSVEQHGTNVTAGGKIKSLTFAECGENHVTVKNAGSLEVHSSGRLTSTGAEISINVTSLGLTCVFTTNATDVGEVTSGTTAKLDIDSVKIPRTGGSIFCGSSGEWTGSYTVTTPDTLIVD